MRWKVLVWLLHHKWRRIFEILNLLIFSYALSFCLFLVQFSIYWWPLRHFWNSFSIWSLLLVWIISLKLSTMSIALCLFLLIFFLGWVNVLHICIFLSILTIREYGFRFENFEWTFFTNFFWHLEAVIHLKLEFIRWDIPITEKYIFKNILFFVLIVVIYFIIVLIILFLRLTLFIICFIWIGLECSTMKISLIFRFLLIFLQFDIISCIFL